MRKVDFNEMRTVDAGRFCTFTNYGNYTKVFGFINLNDDLNDVNQSIFNAFVGILDNKLTFCFLIPDRFKITYTLGENIIPVFTSL